MRKIFAAFLFLSACDGQYFAPELSASDSTPIVGGETIEQGHEYHLKILNFKSYLSKEEVERGDAIEILWKASQCTASAITPRILLTAAHCVKEEAEFQRIELAINGQIKAYNVLKAIQHPDYMDDRRADLAILHLEFALPEEVHLVKLPSEDEPFHVDQVLAAGYGRNQGRKSLPGGAGVLRATILNVIDYKWNARTFTVDQTQGKGICQGDSGGPGIVDVDGKPVVVGVVSNTRYPYTTETDPDICSHQGEYVNIPYYLDWIEPVVKQLKHQ